MGMALVTRCIVSAAKGEKGDTALVIRGGMLQFYISCEAECFSYKISGHTHSERLGSSFTVSKNSGLKPLYNSDTETLKYKDTLHYLEYKVHICCYVPLSN